MHRLFALLLLLPGSAFGADASFLEPSDRRALEEAMRWAELRDGDLDFPRDYVNYGSQGSPDRWRLPSAKTALQEAMALPTLAGEAARSMTGDLGVAAAAPKWGGAFAVVTGELGAAGDGGCPQAESLRSGLAMVDQVAAWDADRGEKWSRRELRDVKARIDAGLDTIVGRLMDELAVARCRVEGALGGIDAAAEDELVAVLDAALRGGDEDPDSEEEGARRFAMLTSAWDAVDRPALLGAARAWSDAVAVAAVDLAGVPENGWPETPMIFPSALGEIWIGSPGSNSGSGDPALLVDPGGDDRWRIGVDRSLTDAPTRRVRGWIDLAGDDSWLGGDVAAGGALLGLAAGIDVAGDDLHRTGRLGLGAAAFGVATWLDLDGVDRYDGSVATQGFALGGAGILRDRGSDGDSYRADGWGQASARFQGVALLHDDGGNDHYVLSAVHEDNPNRLPGYFTGYGQGFAIGLRPYAGGGVAWLLDESGHDRYTGGLWVQGSSYWHSLAGLIDRDGNDLYTSVEYSQGSGIHLSAAGLFDGGGHDRYLTTHLGQGSGHDLAVSWLIDAEGNDAYHGRSTVQGAALTNAVSIFLDRQGDDTYSSRSERWTGDARPARGWGSVALFVDGDGADAYLGRTPPPRNGETVPRETYGAAVDRGERMEDPGEGGKPWAGDARPVRVDDGPPPANAEEARGLLLADPVWTAPRQRMEAAVDRVFRAGPRGVEWVLPLVSDQRLLQSYTVDALIKRWLEDGSSAQRGTIAEAIAASARGWTTGPDVADARWHLRWLAALAQAEPSTLVVATEVAEEFVEAPSFRLRTAAFDTLTAVASIEGLEVEVEFAEALAAAAAIAVQTDTIPEVRAAAARLLEHVGGPGTAASLAKALQTESFVVRGPAEAALVAIAARTDGVAVARGVFALVDPGSRDELPVRLAALRILGATKHRDAEEILEPLLEDDDPLVRRAATVGMERLAAE